MPAHKVDTSGNRVEKSVWSSSEKKGYLGAKLHYSQWSKNKVFKLQGQVTVSAVKLRLY